MSEILNVVIVSTKDKKDKRELLKNINNTCGTLYRLEWIHNTDSKSLTTLYNECISNLEGSYFAFIHDDVEFLKKGWGVQIKSLFERYPQYGIIGVAGSGEFDANAAWWNYTDKWGQVYHRDGKREWLTPFSDIIKGGIKETCMVDGLFIAVNTERISSQFDEEFIGFDHYDTSFCLKNFIDGKCKIGVTTNIKMLHNSVGKPKEQWFINRDLLNKKFGSYYPIKLKREG